MKFFNIKVISGLKIIVFSKLLQKHANHLLLCHLSWSLLDWKSWFLVSWKNWGWDLKLRWGLRKNRSVIALFKVVDLSWLLNHLRSLVGVVLHSVVLQLLHLFSRFNWHLLSLLKKLLNLDEWLSISVFWCWLLYFFRFDGFNSLLNLLALDACRNSSVGVA